MGRNFLALFMLMAGISPIFAAKCDTDPVPAATLLFPYFQLDLDAPNGRTTLFSITNTQAKPVLTNIVVWTEWAIPTLQFHVYLAGYDVQTYNLRDIFVHGWLPPTGKAVSNHGQLSGAPRSFPGCNDTTEPGLAPVYPEPAISSAKRQELAAFHSGECYQGLHASFESYFDNVVRGYVTADVVKSCGSLTPADSGYFGEEGVAGHENVLTGDYFFVDSDENFAHGELAVHVESFPGEFSSGEHTFYERYVGAMGTDSREPLGTQYSFRHLTGGGFDGGTLAIVWRDTGSDQATAVLCDRTPDWWNPHALEGYRVYFDESGNAAPDRDTCVSPHTCSFSSGQATQLVSVGPAQPPHFHPELLPQFPIGRTYLTTRRAITEDPGTWEILQGWVAVMNSAEDRFSVGQRATRLDSACSPTPIDPAPPDFD